MLLLAFLLGFPLPAAGQTAAALDRYEPSGAGAQLAAIPDAEVPVGTHVAGELRMSLARAPLVLDLPSGQQKVVSHQAVLHALVQVALADVLSLGVDVPLLLHQAGDSHDALPAAKGAQPGDLRLAGQFQVVSSQGHRPGASLRFDVWAPTGNETLYAGGASTRIEPAVVVGNARERYAWGASLGRRSALTPSSTELLGPELHARVGGGPRWGDFLLSGELMASFQKGQRDAHVFESFPHLEALVHGRVEKRGWFARAGAGLGLGDALGTPAYRILVGIGLVPLELLPRAKQPPKKEPLLTATGGDIGKTAQSPQGLHQQPHSLSAEGLPLPSDEDGDGVVDALDACPEQPGPTHPDMKLHGCPGDRDADGIVDSEDACPSEAGPGSDQPDDNGCPKSVRIVGTQIVIGQKIDFALKSDEIDEGSHDILQQVAQVMSEHPEIPMVVIEGHTDSTGTLKRNLALSRRRALSVMRWLIDHGVDERRLESTGFGSKRPISTNDTEVGRAKNRRVEFRIERNVAAPKAEKSATIAPLPVPQPAATEPAVPEPAATEPAVPEPAATEPQKPPKAPRPAVQEGAP